MDYHITVSKIINLLKENDLWFETFEHEAVRTSEEAAKTRTGYSLKQGAKALIVRVKKSSEKYFAMLVVPADQKFDNVKVKKLLTAKDIRFATREEVKEITGGIDFGGVPPFGNIFGLKVISDPSLFSNEKIVFNAGDRRFSIAMMSKDYKMLVKPEIKNII
ncbi:MAG: YbaK/EbsC family protein [Candidatus Woesebacteria bacterium]|nr:YbaK/EbsC family protein [Candidatus Woesebacteria bacterium]